MLHLDQESVDEIVAHARADHPDEACGIVAMRDGRPTRVIRMINVERSPTFYVMDAAELFATLRDMEERGEDDEGFVIYHSHTATEAYPSRTDISIAGWPDAHYLIVSTRDPVEVEVRSFRIVDEVVSEEPVVLATGSRESGVHG